MQARGAICSLESKLSNECSEERFEKIDKPRGKVKSKGLALATTDSTILHERLLKSDNSRVSEPQ